MSENNFWGKLKKILIGDPPPPEEKRPKAAASTNESATSGELPPRRSPHSSYRRVKVERGKRGWGGPLIIEPEPGRHLIYSVTGGGIHPVAQRIADMTGGTPFDGFKSKANFGEIAVAVIDCGGTTRVGVYPTKKVPTIDIHATTPSGPLMKYIKEDIFVSGVGEEDITLIDD